MVRELVKRGMNVARINCAHDDAEAWRAMARHIEQAAHETDRVCLIAMDLAGPKLRTGPLEPGPRSVKLRPERNKLGQVTATGQAWLTTAENPVDPPRAGMVSLPVPGNGSGGAMTATPCICTTPAVRSADWCFTRRIRTLNPATDSSWRQTRRPTSPPEPCYTSTA